MGGLNYLLRTVVYAGVLTVVGFGAWHVNDLFADHRAELAERNERIAGLEHTVFDQKERISDLNQALQLLKVDHRLARLLVLDQVAGADGELFTTVRFQELHSDGTPIGASRDFELKGSIAYVDALVIKFEDNYVERGDLWRGTSICLFRRLFGEHQSPSDGFPLDPTGKRPVSYSDQYNEDVDADLWSRFWDYANDVELARRVGVRAMHGEAPYIDLRKGASYLVTLRASGGLAISPE